MTVQQYIAAGFMVFLAIVPLTLRWWQLRHKDEWT